jgi:FixJ family two-component response regulator
MVTRPLRCLILDIAMTGAQGAAECLFKPFSDTALLRALHAALRS